MKNVILSLAMAVIVTCALGQKVGKIDWKADGFTQKKFNNSEKKIFIQHFIVNYQTVMVSYAKARGGNSYSGAVAGLALGLDEVTDEQLQNMTNQYYNDFVAKLESSGFKIMTVDEVQQVAHFSDWGRIEGGEPAQHPKATGYLTTIPAGFTQLDGGAGAFNLGGHPESKQLGGAIVVRVYLTVPFAESQSINGGLVGGVAKITAKADLRVSPSESIPQQGDFKKPINLTSSITFGYKKSLKWQALFDSKLKSDFEIEGVLDENKKYKSTSVGTSGSGFTAKYNDSYSENAILIDCDAQKYEAGVNEAVSTYLTNTLDTFIGYYK